MLSLEDMFPLALMVLAYNRNEPEKHLPEELYTHAHSGYDLLPFWEVR